MTSISRSAVYGGSPHRGSSARSASSSDTGTSKRCARSPIVVPGCARIHGTSASMRRSRGRGEGPGSRRLDDRPAASPRCRRATPPGPRTSAWSSRPRTKERKAGRFTTASSTMTLPSRRRSTTVDSPSSSTTHRPRGRRRRAPAPSAARRRRKSGDRHAKSPTRSNPDGRVEPAGGHRGAVGRPSDRHGTTAARPCPGRVR